MPYQISTGKLSSRPDAYRRLDPGRQVREQMSHALTPEIAELHHSGNNVLRIVPDFSCVTARGDHICPHFVRRCRYAPCRRLPLMEVQRQFEVMHRLEGCQALPGCHKPDDYSYYITGLL